MKQFFSFLPQTMTQAASRVLLSRTRECTSETLNVETKTASVCVEKQLRGETKPEPVVAMS